MSSIATCMATGVGHSVRLSSSWLHCQMVTHLSTNQAQCRATSL